MFLQVLFMLEGVNTLPTKTADRDIILNRYRSFMDKASSRTSAHVTVRPTPAVPEWNSVQSALRFVADTNKMLRAQIGVHMHTCWRKTQDSGFWIGCYSLGFLCIQYPRLPLVQTDKICWLYNARYLGIIIQPNEIVLVVSTYICIILSSVSLVV